MLRKFLIDADKAGDANSRQDLVDANDLLDAQWTELERAWPKDWHRAQHQHLLEMGWKFGDAQLACNLQTQLNQAATDDLHKANELLQAAHKELDDEIRE